MENKFTEGEWKTGFNPISVGVEDLRTLVVCDCALDSDIPADEMWANARLIAAAPNLLSACEAAIRHHQGGHSEIGQILREAIKKARG